jgi:hypothetical protein
MHACLDDLVPWLGPKMQALSGLDAVQRAALFSSKPSLALKDHLVSVAVWAILAALADNAVIVHTDPCFVCSVGS